VKSVWGSTLLHIDDLNYDPYEYLPRVYTRMRVENEGVEVRPLLSTPLSKELPFPSEPEPLIHESTTFIPTLDDFGFTQKEIDEALREYEGYVFKGGEEQGLKRLKEFIFDTKSLGSYGKTRMKLDGLNFASKLSPWLANGTLSIRKVYFDSLKF
jgi:deoxyribodipyrimidine photo-lyase